VPDRPGAGGQRPAGRAGALCGLGLAGRLGERHRAGQHHSGTGQADTELHGLPCYWREVVLGRPDRWPGRPAAGGARGAKERRGHSPHPYGDRDLTAVGVFRHGVGQRPGHSGGPSVQCWHSRSRSHPGRRGRAAARNESASGGASVRQAASAAQPGDRPQPVLPSGDTLTGPVSGVHPGQGQRGVGIVPAQHTPRRRPDHRPGGAGRGHYHRRCPALAPQAAAATQPGP
jgi:hypothetical protein